MALVLSEWSRTMSEQAEGYRVVLCQCEHSPERCPVHQSVLSPLALQLLIDSVVRVTRAEAAQSIEHQAPAQDDHVCDGRAERNRIYRGVKHLYETTSHETSHGKAQCIAYLRVLGVITSSEESPTADAVDPHMGITTG